MTVSFAATIIAKATVPMALGLAGAYAARGARAALRHAVLAAAFGAVLCLPVACLIAPPVAIVTSVSRPLLQVPDENIPAAPTRAHSEKPADAAPQPPVIPASFALSAAWIAGLVFSLIPMLAGLWQVRALRRSAKPWRTHGRVEILLHDELQGPMTCGVLHPAILLPADAPAWEAEDLNRALLHEREHIRRADRATQCLASLACAIYWFHPLVWIARRRLALEAERACDDAVLELSEATAYADQLVRLARRMAAASKSPALAMAGHADLAKRVGALLDAHQRRGRAGTLPVALAAVAAVALIVAISPLTTSAAPQAPAAFDVVSVKLVDPNMRGEHSSERSDPGRLTMTGTLHRFVVRAWGITEGQLSGEPAWFRTRLYSLQAVTSARTGEQQRMLMLRAALAGRFRLKLREETRELPVYTLEVAPGGPKFHELKPDESPEDEKEPEGVYARTFTAIPQLLDSLNGMYGGRLSLDRPAIDRTGLSGRYEIRLRTAMESRTDDLGHRTVEFPDLFQDIQAQLGLKLVQNRAAMPCFVVESAAEPAAN
jgi:uncharacterized protein (TIGR03435 family)